MSLATPSRSLLVLGSVLLAALSLAQEHEPVPAFPSQAEAITVDVVVVDGNGRPVQGLEKTDFTLFEDGRLQTIVGFEPREVSSTDATATAGTPEGAATNETRAESRGRTLAFLVDDLGIDPLHMTEAAKALTHWLDHGADPGDMSS